MNPQEKQQVAARDDKWVPFSERFKISSINIRLETSVPQKEEAFQVVIDLIKNSTCFKAFTISVDVLEIFMQQFWYSIMKVQGTDSYEFILANKKCTINAEVFRTILDICPRVEGVDFTYVPDDDIALTFLIDLGYKGPLYKHTNMFVDHMHQQWRTLAAIINKCLSGKTASNDKLRKSRIDILWGMFKRENVDYPELIWEDIAYQIDHRKEKRSRRESMPYPRFTKIIINHFLKQHKSLTNLNYQHYHTIKDDGIVSRLKFVRIGEDYQEYGLPIPETMLTEAIKQSEFYQMFIKYSTESEPEPEPTRKKTSTNSISQTEAEEAEAARQVHATHARILTKFVPKSSKNSGGRSSKSVVIQDTSSAPKSKPVTSKTNLKEGDRYPFDLSKPLPLQGPPGHQIVAADYFFNNVLEYLKTSDPDVTYTTSITMTKAARYKIKGIKDMVPTLWSTIKHAYDKDAKKGIKHWGKRRKLYNQSQVSKFSKHNVYSTKAFIGVKSVNVKKLHGYGHLEEIVMKRYDQQLYKFKECDFVDLYLNDIEDLLLLAVQHKLFHLDGSDIVDFILALFDELYKFSDGTLKSVRDEIHHRVLDFRMDYNTEMPKRKWTVVDRKRSGLMIELIDKQLREREIIINLERLVGTRELEMDYKLMTHTV
ncbi:hypothetical protein Tco_0627128 [Tanacetum coccineum]|uniref:BTB domain-containing protein n=1 Tax=Tanacetum coccineum TaxID=301880 RepID=A0ABQ4WLK9_9ASTR